MLNRKTEKNCFDRWSVFHFFGGIVLAYILLKFLSIPFFIGLMIVLLIAFLWELFERATSDKESIRNSATDILLALAGFTLANLIR